VIGRDAHPRLLSIGTALPPHIVRQSQAKALVSVIFKQALAADDGRLLAVFDNSGIEARHVCMPLE